MCKHVVLVPVKTVDAGKFNLIEYLKINVRALIICTISSECSENLNFYNRF